MKKLTLLVLFVTMAIFLSATEWVDINANNPSPTKITLLNSDITSSLIHVTMDGYYAKDVKVHNELAKIVSMINGTPILKLGAPEVQKITTSLIIPDNGKMHVNIISSKFKEYKNIDILPSKGNLYRDIDPSDIAYEYGEEYETDAFYPGELASLRDPYIVRDFRGQTVVIYPFQYNPVQKTLRVYYDIVLEVKQVDDNGINTLTRQSSLTEINTVFKGIYDRHFLNYSATSSRYTPVDDHGNMLIISYGNFMDEMQPLVDWKIKAGMPVEIVDVATIGGSAQIKQYISTYYNDNGLTFVLLVGDAAQVPSSSNGGNDSDNNYVYIVGNDHYPDAFIGRFSAENENHVVTQVTRTLEYEMNPITDPDWYSEAIGIASAEGPGDDNEYDYQHIRNINTDLLGFTYTYAYELFDGSQGGEDAPGNPSSADVAIAVNSGASVMTYTGHGSNTAWSTSGFSNSGVNNLTNVGKLPFIYDVACVNGNFVGITCFAEAWLRAEDNGEPTGAIAAMMSTINQSWNPPMCGQDEMIDILTEQYSNNIKRTFAGIGINGCMLMNDEYGSGGNEMTDTWNVFGDPSLMVRTATPATMTVSMAPAILLGTTSYTVTCDAEDGLVALTSNGVILSTAIVENGEAVLQFDPMTQPGLVDLVITGFNYRPTITQIDVIAANGPYLLYADHTVNDSLGNDNTVPEFGETIFLNVGIENLGIDDAVDVLTTISIVDPYVEIIDDTELYELIQVNQTAYKENGFEILLADNIPDQHKLNFILTATDINDSTWINEFEVTAAGPVLTALEMVIDDSETGNNNGLLDAGESAKLIIKTTNEGHCAANDVTASLIAYNPYITVLSGDTILSVLGTFGASYPEFDIEVSDDAPEGILAEMKYQLTSGSYSAERSYFPKVGIILEDWETGDFNKFDWHTGGNQPWVISTLYPYEGDFDVTSGVIGNNQDSELWIQYEVMSPDSISFYKKVSSEADFDKLKFYINNELQAEWSGTSQGWTKEKFAVNPGVRKFRWVYVKDYSGISGADMAWVDYIELPTMMATTVYAGPDDNTCENNNFQCLGSATNYTSIQWETSGTGTFENGQTLNAIYTASEEDIINKTVQLTLTIIDVDGETASDTMELTLNSLPSEPIMPEGPEFVDLQLITVSEYTTQSDQGADEFLWFIHPEEAGTITGTGTTGTVAWNLNYEGEAWVSVAGMNNCGIGNTSDSLLVVVANPVGIIAHESTIISIVPNPNNGLFSISITSAENNIFDVSVVNAHGKTILESSSIDFSNNSETTLDMRYFPSGMYFVIMRSNTSRIVKKLLIKYN